MSSNSRKIKVMRTWLIVLSVLFAFLFIVTMVLTQVGFLYNTINSVLGGERQVLVSGDPDQYQYYTADYDNKDEVLQAANLLNERINEEGIVLLKNEENALPLSSGANITVFGKNSVDAVLGGSGSNEGDTSDAVSDVNVSLAAAGFNCNPVIQSYYKSSSGISRPEVAMGTILTGYPVCEEPLPYSQSVVDSYSQYDDAAIVFISRVGGEGFDLPRTMFRVGSSYSNWDGTAERRTVDGARSVDDHYLQLDQNETDMIAEACENFDNVIVVINSSSPVELGFLDDPTHYAYNENIKAALWIGHPGSSGLNALGRVLNGTVNPSGKLIDTYSRDFTQDPSWYNFGNYMQENGNRYWTQNSNGSENMRNAYFVEYREGIYVGYRYYETMAAEMNAAVPGSGDEWYSQNVVYSFGYGLSYTNFTWDVQSWNLGEGVALTSDGTIEVTVRVTNTGNYAGKEVVQLYYTAPYYDGGIEKAHVVLGDFVKTDTIQPGEWEDVELTLNVRDMASYDYSDANGNNFSGYELETGTYTIRIMSDSHTEVASRDFSVTGDGIRYTSSDVNDDVAVENLFDDVSGHIDEYLSRENSFENFSVLEGASEISYRQITNEFANSLTWQLDDQPTDPWYSEEAPVQSSNELSYDETEIKLYDLIGKDYDDPLWDDLLDQLTLSQMYTLVSVGNYRTTQIENIDKPLTYDFDGPMGFAGYMGDGAVYDTCYYASECVLGATWNTDLAEEFGVMIGNESLIGDEAGDGRTYSGWYAPAMNIHRSPFGGRNFEYYSEDGLLSGKMAVGVVQGAMSKGVYTYAKHFALNEQETNRDTTGLITWANEQSMRELYFKPFELAVKEGRTTAMMSSFNRIGTVWAGGSYNLLTRLLRDEWGFQGMVITDFNLKTYMNVDQMLRAGGDLNLSPEKGPSSTSTATDATILRNATKNILYTVANSNAMNGHGENVKWGYALPWWVIWLTVTDCVVFAGGAVLAVCMAVFTVKNKKASLNQNTGGSDQNE